MGSSILGVVGAVTGTCLRADCVSEPQDRRGSAVRGDAEATVRSGGAGVLPMTLGGRPDIEMGRRWCVSALRNQHRRPTSVRVLFGHNAKKHTGRASDDAQSLAVSSPCDRPIANFRSTIRGGVALARGVEHQR